MSSEQWAVGSGQWAVAKVAIWGIEPGAGACSAGFAPTEQRVQMPVFDHFFYFFATPHWLPLVPHNSTCVWGAEWGRCMPNLMVAVCTVEAPGCETTFVLTVSTICSKGLTEHRRGVVGAQINEPWRTLERKLDLWV